MTAPAELPEELEQLTVGAVVPLETVERIAAAALRWVGPEELVAALGRCWALRPGQRLLILDDESAVVRALPPGPAEGVEDLTPAGGWGPR